jgi:DNA-directed RNA polymerase specialized sigma subunit
MRLDWIKANTKRSDNEAEALLLPNLPLSKKFATKYLVNGWPKHMIEDLRQEAANGLWIACLTYEGAPPPSASFTAWAKLQMRYEIQRFQREMGVVFGRGAGKIMPAAESLRLPGEEIVGNGNDSTYRGPHRRHKASYLPVDIADVY